MEDSMYEYGVRMAVWKVRMKCTSSPQHGEWSSYSTGEVGIIHKWIP